MKKIILLIYIIFINFYSYSNNRFECLSPNSNIQFYNDAIVENNNIIELYRFKFTILKYLSEGNNVIIRITGSPGTGKSTFGKILKNGDWGLNKNEVLLVPEEKIHLIKQDSYKRLTIVEGIGAFEQPKLLNNLKVIQLGIHADINSRVIHMFFRNIFTPWNLIEDFSNKIFLNFSGFCDFSIDTSYGDGGINKKLIKEIIYPKSKNKIWLYMSGFFKYAA